jgi:hypothetical protein
MFAIGGGSSCKIVTGKLSGEVTFNAVESAELAFFEADGANSTEEVVSESTAGSLQISELNSALSQELDEVVVVVEDEEVDVVDVAAELAADGTIWAHTQTATDPQNTIPIP